MYFSSLNALSGTKATASVRVEDKNYKNMNVAKYKAEENHRKKIDKNRTKSITIS